jgi:hypothetical protein
MTIGASLSRASAIAAPTRGFPSWAMANRKTALKKKTPTVIAAIARISRISSAPSMSRNPRPWSTCARRSYIASQIQTAGDTWISVIRQFENSSRTPTSSIATPPTA